MAASVWKGTIFYHALEAGWTETYFLVGPDEATAQTQLFDVLAKRVALSLPEVKVDFIRIVDATSPRVSVGPAIPAGSVAGTYAPTGGSTTITPDLAILIRLYSSDFSARTRHYLRGFPANQFAAGAGGPDALFTYTADYTTLLTAYGNSLVTNTLMAHRTAPHTFTFHFPSSAVPSTSAHIRRAGRPFGLRRGRRLIA